MDFECENGTILKLKPVNDVLVAAAMIQWRKQYIAEHPKELIEVPTYKTKLAGGDSEELPLSADALEVPGDAERTALNKARWARHLEALGRVYAASQEAQIMVQLMLGVECDVPDDGWEETIKFLGIEISEVPTRRKAQWLIYVCLTTYDRAMLIPQLMMQATARALDPAQIELFRSRAGAALEGRAREAFDKALEALRPLARQPVTDSSAGDGQVPDRPGSVE